MRKARIFAAALFVAVVCIVPRVQAQQETQPSNSAWYEPASAKPGETVTLNAFIYNTIQAPVTLTVAFQTDNKKVLGTEENIAVGVGSGATVTQSWTMPETRTEVNVVVTKALNDKRSEVKSLEGIAGTIVLDPTQPQAAPQSQFKEEALASWNAFYTGVTDWRLKEAAYCKDRKAHYEGETGVTFQPDGEGKNLLPLNPGDTGSTTVTSTQDKPTGAYFNLLWSSACSTFFGNEIIFFVATGLLLLLIIRMLLRVF